MNILFRLSYTVALVFFISGMLVFGTPVQSSAADESITAVTNLGGAMRGCIVDGDTVYAVQEPRLIIVDISTPAAPVLKGSIPLPGIGRRLTKKDTYLYIACWEAGLVVVDIADETAPKIVKQIVFDTSAVEKNPETQDVEVKGDYAYVIDQHAGFITLDISNPANPVIVDTFTDFDASNYNGYDVNIVEDTLYLSCEFDGVYFFDISTPSKPSLISRFPQDPTDISQPNNFYKSILDGNFLHIAAGGVGFAILDVSDISNPQLVSTLDNSYGGVISIALIDGYIYLCTEFANFYKIDVSDPANPVQVEEFDVYPYHSIDVSHEATTIALANRDFGLRILDVSSGSIVQVGILESLGQIQDCKGAGNYAYVAGLHQGVRILDVSDPGNPDLVQTVALEGNINGIFLLGDKAYTAEVDRVEESGGYLEIIDISAPTAASVLGSIELPGRPFNVVVDGTTAYVALQTEGIALVDVSDPSNPQLVSTYDTAGSCYAVDVRGDLIIAGDGTRGSLVLDARDTSSIKKIMGGFDNGTLQDIAVWDTLVLAPGGDEGLTITDIAAPYSPATAAVLPVELLGYEEMNIKAAAAFDSYLLTIETDGAAGQVRLIDIADAENPVVLDGSTTMFGDAIKISYSPDQKLAYGSSQIAGLFIYDVDTDEPVDADIDGIWAGSGTQDGSTVGITAEIDQARDMLSGTITLAARSARSGSFSGTVSADGSITGTLTLSDGTTASASLSYSASSDTVSGSLSGGVTVTGIALEQSGIRGQIPFAGTAATLSSTIEQQLAAGAGPLETLLLQQANSSLEQGLAAEDLGSILGGAAMAELYLKIMQPEGTVAAANLLVYPSALWDTGVSQAIVQAMISDICPDFKDDLQDTIKQAERLMTRAQRFGDSGLYSLALNALSKAAVMYDEAVSQYYQLKPDCPSYDVEAFDGFYEGTIDFGFAIGEVRFCTEQAADGTVTGEAIISIAATGEKMGGMLMETVNETINEGTEKEASLLNGYIQVFVGSTEAHVLMIDWQHNPSTNQWEGRVDVDLQPVNATAAVKKTADECPADWDSEFAEVTGD